MDLFLFLYFKFNSLIFLFEVKKKVTMIFCVKLIFVALNVSLVLWAAGVEDDVEKGFEKALFSMSKAKPWDKLLLLKAYLES